MYHNYEANLLLRNDEIVLLCNAFVGARWQDQGTGANISLTSDGGAAPNIPSSFVTRRQMLLDISPLCLYHNVSMILTQETLHPRRVFEETYRWFDCPISGCNQRYDLGRGYDVMREGALEDETNKQPCPECSLRLYLAKRSATLADSVWLCVNEDCPSNERKRVRKTSSGVFF